MASDFERIGGEAALRPLIDEFVDRCFDDMMIGFLFQRASRDRVKRFEYEHAAAHLGAGVAYGGRALRVAHGPHAILGGQFARRLHILRETLAKHGVPEDVAERWLAYHESLRGEVTADPTSDCNPEAAEARVRAFRAERKGGRS